MNRKIVDKIVWWVPFRKLRDYTRNYINNAITKNEECFYHVPNGHYYSPIPSKIDVLNHIQNSKDINKIDLDGINLNLDKQLKYLSEFIKIKDDIKLNIELGGGIGIMPIIVIFLLVMLYHCLV